MKHLIHIAGPTAIGKTRLAIALAKHFQTEILSCDSRQFYQEMCIGTAVPNTDELADAPHHFIQHISIHEKYSVGDYEKDALTCLQRLFSEQKKSIAILVGGSGLYSNAVIKGLDYFPNVPNHIRKLLNHLYQEKGLPFIQETLRACDPSYAEQVDIHNPQRIIRALEVFFASGEPFSSFLGKNKPIRPFHTLEIGLKAPQEVLHHRINTRIDIMLSEGLLPEIQHLYPFRSLNALQTVGYQEFFDFFEGKTNLATAIDLAKLHTRQFAKRQYTWYHKSPHINWFDYDTDTSTIIQYIENALRHS